MIKQSGAMVVFFVRISYIYGLNHKANYMKNCLFILLLVFSATCFSQSVTLNETLKLYEYSHVKELTGAELDRIKIFSDKMKEFNYSDIQSTEDNIKGENFFTKMITGSAMEVHFNVLILFKEGKYKLTVNNFRIKDVRYGTVAVETLGKSSQKRWVNFINEQLPQVISNLENTDKW